MLLDGVWFRSAVESLLLFLALLLVQVLALVTTLYALHCKAWGSCSQIVWKVDVLKCWSPGHVVLFLSLRIDLRLGERITPQGKLM